MTLLRTADNNQLSLLLTLVCEMICDPVHFKNKTRRLIDGICDLESKINVENSTIGLTPHPKRVGKNMVSNGLKWLEIHFKHYLFLIFLIFCKCGPGPDPPKCGIFHTFFFIGSPN